MIHLIHSACDVTVESLGLEHVRVRITEKDPELLNPTDLEIEGDPAAIMDAFSNILFVLAHSQDFKQKGAS